MNAFTHRVSPISLFKLSQQPRVLRSIAQQPPQCDHSWIATPGTAAAGSDRHAAQRALQEINAPTQARQGARFAVCAGAAR